MIRTTKHNVLHLLACLLLFSQVWATVFAPGLSLFDAADIAIELCQSMDCESESESDEDKKEKKDKHEALGLSLQNFNLASAAMFMDWNSLRLSHHPEISLPPPEQA